MERTLWDGLPVLMMTDQKGKNMIDELKKVQRRLTRDTESLDRIFMKHYGKPCHDVTTLEVAECNLEGYEKDFVILLRQEYMQALAKLELVNEMLDNEL